MYKLTIFGHLGSLRHLL